ncbi:LPS export ABC transporter periplasmic protein LptC [Chitinophaga lutea]
MKRLLSYGLIALAFCSCENDMNAVRQFDQSKMGVEQGYDVETILSQQAHVKGVLTSPYMERHVSTPPYTEFPRGLRVQFYNDSLQTTSVLTARYGKYMDGENDVYLRDSVVFVNLTDMRRLDCQDLRWDNKKELFITDKPCRLTSPGQTIYGTGFEANRDFSWGQFKKTHGSFLAPDSTFME